MRKKVKLIGSPRYLYLKKILIVSVILILFFGVFSSLLFEEKEKKKLWEEFDLKEKLENERESVVDTVEVKVYDHKRDEIFEKDLEKYLVGVVAAEMPPQFEKEALKAQGVVARSYTLSKMKEFGGEGCNKVANADICTDPDHCQDYMTKEEAVKLWGKQNFEKLWSKVERSIFETQGEVLTYNGEQIAMAPYHSTCGGKTELSKKVWEKDISFIDSVECHYCKHSEKHTDKKSFNWKEFKNKVSTYLSQFLDNIEAGKVPLEVTSRSSTGRVKEAKLGGQMVSGNKVREIFDLNSTNFVLENTGEKWTFHTSGFGHGVGFCQYGADGKAKEGYDYIDIISFYFSGLEIKNVYKKALP